jgi:PAS domain S-box-containing protein
MKKIKNNIQYYFNKLTGDGIDYPQQAAIGIFLGLIFVLSMTSGIIMYFAGMSSYWTIFLLGGICLVGGFINWLGQTIYKKILSHFLIVVILIILQYNLLQGYGIHDIAIITWPAVIFLCGLLFGSQMIPFVGVAVILLAIYTRFAPNAEHFIGASDTGDLMVMLVVLFAFSLAAWLLLRRNEYSLARLRKSEARAQTIFNSVNDAIFILDIKTGAILEVNDKVQEMFVYPRSEAVLLDFETISSGIPPYQQQDIRAWLQKASTLGPQIFEWQAKNKNGRVFWVDVNMKMADFGEQSLAVVSIRDITERKQAEMAIRSINIELERRVSVRTMALDATNKELEAFAYSVSHDLRAPLRTSTGFLNIILEDYQDKLDDQLRQYLVQIKDASVRMGQLINDLLDLSRINSTGLTRETFDFSALVHNIAANLQQQDSQRQVKFDISDNLWVNGDHKLIRIVMENLLGNAYKFTSQCDLAIIEVGAFEKEGERVYFVRDNGAGFNMAYVNKLFTPFQRLHQTQDFPGTGIGLATVQRVITRHRGRIWAEGVVNQGATFYFVLGDAG